jgi:hypothetical protein
MTVRQFRPMNIGDLFDNAFRIYRGNFRLLISIIALPFLPFILVSAIVRWVTTSQFYDTLGDPSRLTNFESVFSTTAIFFVATYGLAFAQSLLFLIIYAALITAISHIYYGKEITVGTAYREGLKRFWTLLGGSFLLGLLAIVIVVIAMIPGFLFLFASFDSFSDGDSFGSVLSALVLIGGVFLILPLLLWLFTKLMFYGHTAVIEQTGVFDSLRRSWSLVTGSFWRSLGISLLLTLLVYIVAVLPAIIVSLLVTLLFGLSPAGMGQSQALSQTVSGLVTELLFIFVIPIQLGGLTMLYFDLRIRKEGLDLEIQSASPPPTAPVTLPTDYTTTRLP